MKDDNDLHDTATWRARAERAEELIVGLEHELKDATDAALEVTAQRNYLLRERGELEQRVREQVRVIEAARAYRAAEMNQTTLTDGTAAQTQRSRKP